MRHGGVSSLVKLALKEPSPDDSHVQTIAEQVPPPLFASELWAIASEEAVHNVYSPHALIVLLWLRNVYLFV